MILAVIIVGLVTISTSCAEYIHEAESLPEALAIPDAKPVPVSGVYRRWATAIDEPQCAHISKKIYEAGGTLADATVATMLCLGVVLPESLGLGGGFLATYFEKKTGKVYYLNARESAPAAATQNMFVNSTSVGGETGARSICVPGELLGYEALLQKIGSNISRKTLFAPAIAIAKNGFKVGEHLAESMENKADLIYQSPELKRIYWNSKTNTTHKAGAKISNPDLARTLTTLSQSTDAVKMFYKGTLARNIVEKVQKEGGILTLQDLMNYKVEWGKPAHTDLMGGKYQLYSSDLPGSGPVLSFLLNIMDAYNQTTWPEDALSYHRFIEACTFAYAQRSLLGDPKFVPSLYSSPDISSKAYAFEARTKISDAHTLPLEAYGGTGTLPEDHGTSHANFLAPNGDAIAITSTVNFYFGSGVVVDGILMNNEMDDFSTPGKSNGFGLPPSPSNFIAPGKRPMSSMAPTIVVRNGEAVLLVGGAGGSKITSGIASVIMSYFWQHRLLKDAIAKPRLHHQYLPDNIVYEEDFDQDIMDGLKAMGHKFAAKGAARGNVIVGIAKNQRENDYPASVDPRKGGGTAGGALYHK